MKVLYTTIFMQVKYHRRIFTSVVPCIFKFHINDWTELTMLCVRWAIQTTSANVCRCIRVICEWDPTGEK